MPLPSFHQFKKLSQKGNLIAVTQEIYCDQDSAVSLFNKIRQPKNNFLFESVQGAENWARYSFMGNLPKAIIKGYPNRLEIHPKNQSGVKKEEIFTGNPYQALQNYFKKIKIVGEPKLARFSGGLVGFFAFESMALFEPIQPKIKDDLNLALFQFMQIENLVIFDNFLNQATIISLADTTTSLPLKEVYQKACNQVRATIAKISKNKKTTLLNTDDVSSSKLAFKKRDSQAQYEAMVKKGKEFIKAGDIFQVVLSTRFESTFKKDPFDVYRLLRLNNPSPYLFFLEFDDLQIAGASPEVMVRLQQKDLVLRPIAGTMPRSSDLNQDKRYEEKLKSDIKELAEHIMLVDLGRNDLGRVSQMGSVKVKEMKIVERYSHVMHLVSEVVGKLKKGKNLFDVIAACFPAGTLSGAPKIRAVEIISELEGWARGLYGGAVGYLGYNGNMDLAIAIRSALFKNQKAYVQAGAGIVYNSKPKSEYQECLNKAHAVLKAVDQISKTKK